MSTYDLGDLFAALTGRSVDPKRIPTRILEHKTYVDLGGPEEDPMTERILELGSPPRVRLNRVNGSYHLTLDSRVMVLPRETARRIAACILTDLERDRACEED